MMSPPSALQVMALGQVHISFHGRPLTFRMNKAAGLLIYLMRESKKAHGREQLATLLWPEETSRKSAENLRQALYQLRRALGEEADTYLLINYGTIQFNPTSPHTLDANLFEQAVAQQDWQTAEQQYQGDFLADFHASDSILFTEWQLITREHLHQLAGRALGQLAKQAEAAQAHGRAEQAAQRLLALEPWAEEAHRLLMRLWARQGQHGRALTQYEKCASLLADELGTTPTAETTTLYEQIRDGRWPPPATPTSSPTTNLPASLTPLVAREAELADLTNLLHDPTCRLLTIVGTGGMGKTKLLLALGWACHHAQQYAAGVLFASLAELEPRPTESTSEQIASYLLRQLGSANNPTSTASDTELLVQQWHGRPLLLLLDNWEHLLEGATLLSDLLAALPDLHIATTSREPLNLQGEWLYPLHGLTLPTAATAENVGQSGAGQLFGQAARRVQPQFQLDEQTATAVYTICHALEGHPLALEMASASLRGLTVAEVAQGVAEGLDLLTTNQPNVPPRQRDLRQLLAYSWGQLSPNEQIILAQLSLFRQPFTTAGAQSVTGAGLVQMAALVARFWLRRTADGRYQTHELLRHFAREQLAQSPTQPAAESRYIRYHLNHIAQQQVRAGHLLAKEMLAEWTRSWADVEQAWAGALRREMWGELEGAIAAVSAFYLHKGLLADGIRFLAQAAEEVQAHLHPPAADPTAQRVWVLLLIEQAHLRNIQVQSQPVPALMAQAVAGATALGDLPLQWSAQVKWVRALNCLGQAAEARQKGEAILAEMGTAVVPHLKAELWNSLGIIYLDHGGALGQGERYLRQSMEQYEALEIAHEAARVRHNLALILAHMGRLPQAQRLFQTNLAWWRAYPTPSLMGMTREGLGYVYLQWGRLGAAASHLQAAMQLYEQLEDWDGVAYASLYLGQVAGRQGAWAAAERHYRTAVRLRHKLNHPRLLPPCWAGLAEAAWRQGHTAEAHRHLAQAVPALLAEEIEGEDMAQAYAVVARLLREMGDEAGAEGVRQVGWRRLQEQAAALGEDTAVRETFLTAVPSHRWLAEGVTGVESKSKK